MRLITFEDSVKRSRIGAVTPDGRVGDLKIVDLNSACALYCVMWSKRAPSIA